MDDVIQVLAVDLGMDEARSLARDAGALGKALGTEVPVARVSLIDPATLADIGLSNYLVEGEGAKAEAVAVDRTRLDKVRSPVLLLLPGALGGPATLDPAPPLSLLGEYPLHEARPAEGTLRSESAEGLIAGTPPQPEASSKDRRVSGYVALAALIVALLVALVVWIVAA